MLRFRFSLDTQGAMRWLAGLFGGFDRRYGQYAQRQAVVLQEFMRREAPKRTGQFASGIRAHAERLGDKHYRIVVTFPSPLYEIITKGTRPHKIDGMPLRFVAKQGKVVYARHVNHPGTKANPFDQRALALWRPIAEDELRRV